MSWASLKRLDKGQEKSNFPKKVMGMVLTNPPKRGIFITLISTRTARVLTTANSRKEESGHGSH